MDKTSRFYFFTITAVKLIVSFFILGFIRDLIQQYLVGYNDIADNVIIVYNALTIFIRTLIVIGFISIIVYYIYTSYRYMTSMFYTSTRIPLHEAFYHGYLDLAYTYERLGNVADEIIIDTKTRSIIVKKGVLTYHVLVREYFGKILGEARSSTWYLVSKKKKEYGRITYKKKKPITNPIEENKTAIFNYNEKHGVTCINYVCLTGLQRNTFLSENINTVYEIEALIK